MSVVLKNVNEKLDDNPTKLKNNQKSGYHDFGKKLIWKSIRELKLKNNYPSHFDGTRDKDGNQRGE